MWRTTNWVESIWYAVSMSETKNENRSPLVRGKPRWRGRQMRFFVAWALWNFVGIGYLAFEDSLPRSPWIVVAFFGGYALIGFVYVGWMRSYGLKGYSINGVLLGLDGVACPNCLYALCSVEEAAGEKVCPECGCAIDGVEAMEAWGRVEKWKIAAGGERG